MIGAVRTRSIHRVCHLGDFVEERLAVLVVMVTMPHYVVGGRTLAVARWVIAQVGGAEACGFQAVGCADTSSQDGLQESAVLPIVPVVVVGVFLCQVRGGGVVVEVGSDADHIFTVAGRLLVAGATIWARIGSNVWKRLVGPVLEVVQDGVLGSFTCARVEERGVRRVKW